MDGEAQPGGSRERSVALAEQARAQSLWQIDAFHRRQICLRPDASTLDWLQYGHALKEMGCHAQAETAYRTAVALEPGSAEPVLQLGLLLATTGRYADAAVALAEALRLGGSGQDHARRELAKVRVCADSLLPNTRDEVKSGLHVYLSSPVKPFGEDHATGLAGLGEADYSYAFAMRNFVDALERLGIAHSILTNPEWIPDIRTRSRAEINFHLGFYPPERVRLLKGAHNILCFAWEFERLRSPDERSSYHAFADQVTMLAVPDEVWVLSSFGADVVREAIASPVRHVPAPIITEAPGRQRRNSLTRDDLGTFLKQLERVEWRPLAIVPRIQRAADALSERLKGSLRSVLRHTAYSDVPKFYVTVASVHDFRKQFRPMLKGFVQFSLQHPNAYLLIKMTTPHRGHHTANQLMLEEQIFEASHLIPPMLCDRVWISDQRLTRQEMNSLYDIADFYLCTSYAEGQNLPLLEAMARGTVPVSVDGTAMKDYVAADNAVVIASRQARARPRMTMRYHMFGLSLAEVNSQDVYEALTASLALSDEEYEARSRRARAVVEERFCPATLGAAIDAVVSASRLRGAVG